MHRLLIISIHLLFASFGALEYCVSKGVRKFKYKSGSYYSAQIPYAQPAYQDIMISLPACRGEADLTSYMLCIAYGSSLPLLITGKITLN